MVMLEKDAVRDMEVCTVVVAETRSRLRKDTDARVERTPIPLVWFRGAALFDHNS